MDLVVVERARGGGREQPSRHQFSITAQSNSIQTLTSRNNKDGLISFTDTVNDGTCCFLVHCQHLGGEYGLKGL